MYPKGTPTFVGFTPRNVAPVFNVRDYGATGDGATDDLAAIQAAVDACVAAGGGVVFAPPGEYIVSDRVDLGASVWLRGAGMGVTTFRPQAYGDPGATGTYRITGRTNDRGVITSLNVDNVTVSDLSVDCDELYLGGIALFGGADLAILQCEVYDCPNAAMQIAGKMDSNVNPATSAAYNNVGALRGRIQDCHADRTLWAYVLDGECVDCHIINNTSTRAVRRHISIDWNAGYGTAEASNGVVSGNIVSGSLDAPAAWVTDYATFSTYSQAEAIGRSGDYIVSGNVVRGWEQQTTVAPTTAGYALAFGPSSKPSLIGNTVVGASGALITRGVDLETVGKGVVVDGNTFQYCATGVRVRGTGEGVTIRGNRFADCTTPMNVSATDRLPAQAATVIRDNYDEDGVADPGFAQINVFVLNGSTSGSGNHGLGVLPESKHVRVLPVSGIGAAKHWWVSNLTTTNVAISTDADPGTNVTFVATVDLRG